MWPLGFVKCSLVQVYLLDKRFVDPRRPKGTPTADEKMEMLPPYAEELPFTPTLFASHKEAIEGLAGQSALFAGNDSVPTREI